MFPCGNESFMKKFFSWQSAPELLMTSLVGFIVLSVKVIWISGRNNFSFFSVCLIELRSVCSFVCLSVVCLSICLFVHFLL